MANRPPGYESLPTQEQNEDFGGSYPPANKLRPLHSPGPNQAYERPASNPGTPIYYELYSPSGPISSSSSQSSTDHRSFIILEDIAPPRTWKDFCARVGGAEGIHTSRLKVFTTDGCTEYWAHLPMTDVSLEESTSKRPFPVKCFLGEGETMEDARNPRVKGRSLISRCFPCF